jgi:hypothetical protein
VPPLGWSVRHEPGRARAAAQAHHELRGVDDVRLAVFVGHDAAASPSSRSASTHLRPVRSCNISPPGRPRSWWWRPEHQFCPTSAEWPADAAAPRPPRAPGRGSASGLAAVGVELQVREVGAASVERRQGVEGHGCVARQAQAQAGQVHRAAGPGGPRRSRRLHAGESRVRTRDHPGPVWSVPTQASTPPGLTTARNRAARAPRPGCAGARLLLLRAAGTVIAAEDDIEALVLSGVSPSSRWA